MMIFFLFLLNVEDEIRTVIGIDLGTTFSCVGIFQRGKVDIIPNEIGNRITPSIVSFDESKTIVGDSALQYLISNPRNTIYTVKRLIGRRFHDKEVQSELPRLPYSVVDKDDHIFLNISNQLFTPEFISSLILKKMKSIAEDFLGKQITHAVITVPAYFSHSQRQATKDAGSLANLTVLRILNEPTAAAMAYGLDKKDNQKIIVFDLGGGTFDVSLLSIDEQFFEVIATAGDTHLGGEDFDNRVVDYFLNVFNRKTGKNASTNFVSVAKLKKESEKAKRILSTNHQTRIEIENFFDGENFDEYLTRAKFEELNMDLLKKCLKPVQQVLDDSGLQKEEIDEIVLVGGSTRLPKIRKMIQEFFDGKDLCLSINPDEAVAYGAAVQGGILSNDPDLREIALTNVCPLTLGIETFGGLLTPLIPRNTKIPVKKTQIFTNAHDDQDTVEISVFEGERTLVRDNHLLGTFELTDLPPQPRGTLKIEVTFSLDQNSILKVTAKEQGTDNQNSIEITAREYQMSQEDVERMQREAEKNKDSDEQMKRIVMIRNDISFYLSKAKKIVEGKEELENVIKEGEEFLEEDTEDFTIYQRKYSEIRKILDPHLHDPQPDDESFDFPEFRDHEQL